MLKWLKSLFGTNESEVVVDQTPPTLEPVAEPAKKAPAKKAPAKKAPAKKKAAPKTSTPKKRGRPSKKAE
jgi:hypothetical protein